MIDAPAPLLLPLLHAAIRRSCMHACIYTRPVSVDITCALLLFVIHVVISCCSQERRSWQSTHCMCSVLRCPWFQYVYSQL